MTIRSVLITGGAGYVGALLTPRLLAAGYQVVVYDLMYYGCFLQPHPDLRIIEADIRDTGRFAQACHGIDAVIHLACISNDPSFELDEALSRSINYDCFEPMVTAAKAAGVRRFLYASSSSVYGVSDAPEVTEEHPLVPLTLYSRFKGLCEPLLFRHQAPDFVCTVIRPATLCGYSPRMRFDLTVNILTNHAVNKGAITVFGGEQKRPNLHVDDMCDLYRLILEAPDDAIAGETYNVGFQNHTVHEIASMVRDTATAYWAGAGVERPPVAISTTPTNDIRSYHISSAKIAARLGFRPRRGVSDAVGDLCRAFTAGLLPDSLTNPLFFNLETLKRRRAA